MPERTVLLVNKFYHDRGPAGGVGRYLLQEEEDLTAAGWRVVPFAMADADARPSPWAPWFVRSRDYSQPRWSAHAPADALALLWNRQAARRLDDLVGRARPEVAHLHNIYHHLSPSILPVLARRRVPVVMTLHDLRLLCPAIHMLRGGQVCERCRGGRFHEAVLGRCVKGSPAASLLAALETAHQHHRRLYLKHVGLFICPSRFYRDKYAAWGYPEPRLIHLPNFVDTGAWRPTVPPDADPCYLYFGRVSAEKGLAHLLQAQKLWESATDGVGEGGAAARSGGPGEAAVGSGTADGGPAPRLLIAGSGPWDGELRRRVTELRLRRVELLGPLDGPAVRAALARARFTVLPSTWYENAPLAVLESMAAGRPVAGADIGGIPELIEDGADGVLLPPGDAAGMLAGLRRALALGPEAGARARAKAERLWSRPAHMARLQEILADAAAKSAAAPPSSR